jgi:copper homeostasis protein
VRTEALVRAAHPLGVTFHRAFDVAVDAETAFEEVIASGAERLLTSGQQQSAREGIPLLAQLIERAADRIKILPGAGIDVHNVSLLLRSLNVLELHLAKGVKKRNNEGTFSIDPEKLREFIAAIRK